MPPARARPRAGRRSRRARLGLDVDDLEAGEPLLELLEGAVGDHRRVAAVRGDDLRQVRPGEDSDCDQLAAVGELAFSAR
jgi:hypothetical protein